MAVALALALVLAGALTAQAAVDDIALVSRAAGPAGTGADGDSNGRPAVSNSGRYIAFVSSAANLTPGTVPGVDNVYVRDTATNALTLVSRADGADGAAANGDSTSPAIVPGGRYVAFQSVADNLSSEDNDAVSNVYLRDTMLNTTTLVSRAGGADGAAGDGDSRNPSVSLHASVIAFESDADNLTPDANPAVSNVFIRNRDEKDTSLVSRAGPTFADPAGPAADGASSHPSISSNGARIAFQSVADNLSGVDNDAVSNVYLRNLRFRSTIVLSCSSGGFGAPCPDPGDGDSTNPSISADGGFVAFQSDATSLSSEDDDSYTDVFLRDASASTTTLISRATGATGAAGAGRSLSPTVSGHGGGQFVAFASAADNLSDEDVATYDIFVRDRLNSLTTLASRGSGLYGPAATGSSIEPAISGDGQVLAFLSEADNLSTGDDDGVRNVFTRGLSLTPPPPPPVLPQHCHSCPDSSDTSAHAGHAAAGGAGHAGHGTGAGAHADHGTIGAPRQTVFAPGSQRVGRLYVLVQVHQRSKLRVRATVKMPGASRVYRFRAVQMRLPIHAARKVKLRLSRSALRAVRQALKQGKRLRAKVTVSATDTAGARISANRRIKLKP